MKPKNIKIHPQPKGYVDGYIFVSFNDSEDQVMYSCQNTPDGETLLKIEEDIKLINHVKKKRMGFTGFCS